MTEIFGGVLLRQFTRKVLFFVSKSAKRAFQRLVHSVFLVSIMLLSVHQIIMESLFERRREHIIQHMSPVPPPGLGAALSRFSDQNAFARWQNPKVWILKTLNHFCKIIDIADIKEEPSLSRIRTKLFIIQIMKR
jgi:hypothetical protein